MRFSKDFPDKLRSSILASEVIARKVQLKKKVRNFKACALFITKKLLLLPLMIKKDFIIALDVKLMAI